MSSGRGSKKYREAVAKRRNEPSKISPSIDSLLEKFTGPAPSPAQQEPPVQQTPLVQQEPPVRQEPLVQREPPVQREPRSQQTPVVHQAPLVTETPDPLPQTPRLQQAPLVYQEGDVELVSEYSKTPNTWVDETCALTNVYAQAIYTQFLRLSYGFKRDWCIIGYPRLSVRANVSESQTRRAIKILEQMGLIEQLKTDMSSPNKNDWGILWRVNLPKGTPVRRTGGAQQTGGTQQTRGTRQTGMKERRIKDHENAPVAVAPAPGLYEVRTVAARLLEAHRNDLGFDHARLRSIVRDALTGQGRDVDDDVLDEAIRGMAS